MAQYDVRFRPWNELLSWQYYSLSNCVRKTINHWGPFYVIPLLVPYLTKWMRKVASLDWVMDSFCVEKYCYNPTANIYHCCLRWWTGTHIIPWWLTIDFYVHWNVEQYRSRWMVSLLSFSRWHQVRPSQIDVHIIWSHQIQAGVQNLTQFYHLHCVSKPQNEI